MSVSTLSIAKSKRREADADAVAADDAIRNESRRVQVNTTISLCAKTSLSSEYEILDHSVTFLRCGFRLTAVPVETEVPVVRTCS